MNPPNKQVLISSTHLLDLSISVILLFFLKFLHSYMHLLSAGIASETSYLFFYSYILKHEDTILPWCA